MTVLTLTTPGAGSWTVPAGVTVLEVECWGGGGSGGFRATVSQSATAGGGAGWSKTNALAVTPGQTVYYYVGAGGASVATTANGFDGEATWLNQASNAAPVNTAQGCLAVRGRRGSHAVAVATGAATTSAGHVGDTVRNSRNTSSSSAAPTALGGSGSSGPNGLGSLGGQNTGEGPGYQGDGTSGGAGGAAGGGNGVSDILGGGGGGGMNSSAAPAGDGGLPGGGGGGGVNPATRSGAGGAGQIKITYTAAASTTRRRVMVAMGA